MFGTSKLGKPIFEICTLISLLLGRTFCPPNLNMISFGKDKLSHSISAINNEDVKRKSSISLKTTNLRSLLKNTTSFLFGDGSISRSLSKVSNLTQINSASHAKDLTPHDFLLSQEIPDLSPHTIQQFPPHDNEVPVEFPVEFPRLGGNSYFIRDQETLSSLSYDYYAKYHLKESLAVDDSLEVGYEAEEPESCADPSVAIEKYASVTPPTEIIDEYWNSLMVFWFHPINRNRGLPLPSPLRPSLMT
ncbi:hypothetical protein DI09_60p40 [Mitosporidium daphniae]|uniref:Uncharacterized protein n=1 Tax=Mitosporidium daphniae TaxID=1485682 RepID=A0A098VNI4_9MICR|nr:uncharacterized protein DI09_60p40 [Mitosporidium daphniae]KGG50637.1 hypothetical protein DI09_60p40 [Mitosporidium daphniae]|eukprot:XP_013237081.1 uncharacterized protein DI09_60p40 [Mitosporidium daphniae]